MKLTLIGLRGTGKSTIGRLIGQRLDWPFVDVDGELERREGRSIATIFETDGEPTFRQLEEALLAELLQSEASAVIAAGGGAILNEQSRERMRAAGPVAWLTASVDVLSKRLTDDEKTSSQRPSLTGQAVAEEIETVLKARRLFYQRTATITVPAGDESPDHLADDIITRLRADLDLPNDTASRGVES